MMDSIATFSRLALVVAFPALFGHTYAEGVLSNYKHKGKAIASTMDVSPLALFQSQAAGHGLVTKTMILSHFRDSTLKLAIRDIGLAFARQPRIPPTGFFMEVVVHDDFWHSKGKHNSVRLE